MKHIYLITDNREGLKQAYTKLKTLATKHGMKYDTLLYQFSRKKREWYKDELGRTVEQIPLDAD